MRKDSVLNLKKNLLRTLARRGFQRPNQLEGLASSNIEERLAVGYSHLGKGSYRLELRVQRGNGAAYRLAEEFKQKARQEANIEEVPRIEIPLDPIDGELVGLKTLVQHKRPLHIGLSISHSDGPRGTLGAFATDDHGSLGILSNNHVLALMGAARLRDRVTQPGMSNLADNEIGFLSNYILISRRRRDSSDAAFAILDGNIPHESNLIPSGLGFPFAGTTIKEIQPADELLALLKANTPVCKIGSTTGFTEGRVTAIGVDNQAVETSLGPIVFNNLIEVEHAPGKKPFTKPGDSGSMVFTKDGFWAVGLHFAGGFKTIGQKRVGVSYSCNMAVVLRTLKLTLWHQ